jgi:hypothetical protein
VFINNFINIANFWPKGEVCTYAAIWAPGNL